MTRRVIVLGGGTGGTIVANRLARAAGSARLAVTVVDRDDRHVYQPGLLFVPFGAARPEALVRTRRGQLRPGVTFVRGEVDRVSLDGRFVVLSDGRRLDYDVLVIASGATLRPDETEGLTGPGWMQRVFTFYDLAGATALGAALRRFDRGRLAVAVMDMPIKCPVAPLEFCFLADDLLRRRGVRDQVEISYVTPLDAAFTKPVAARALGHLLADRGIDLVADFTTAAVDGGSGRLTSYDGREVGFDLGVVVPLHGGAPYVERSRGLGDPLGFVPTDPNTLQSLVAGEVFAVGDATDLRASKAGSVAHFEAEVLAGNVLRFLAGEPLEPAYDGHANCFVETGGGRALLIDFNDTTEPVPGHFPARVGLPLLHESRLNHLGKRAFEWIYWHALLPGHSLPLIGPAMPTRGKELAAAAPKEG